MGFADIKYAPGLRVRDYPITLDKLIARLPDVECFLLERVAGSLITKWSD